MNGHDYDTSDVSNDELRKMKLICGKYNVDPDYLSKLVVLMIDSGLTPSRRLANGLRAVADCIESGIGGPPIEEQ